MAGTKKREDKRIAANLRSWRALGWWPELAIIACSLAVAGCAWTWAQVQTTAGGNSAKTLTIPANLQMAEVNGPVFALSPDGGKIVFAARDGAHQQLYARMTNQDQSSPTNSSNIAPIPGTEGAEAPFFSPDGEWVGFFAAGKLKKVSLAAGNVVTICDAPAGRGGSWGDNGVIVFTPTLTSGLWQVPASGGEAKVLTELKNERGHRWPDVLPGGKAFLYTVAAGGEWDNAQIVVQDFATGQRQTVIASGTYGHYSPTGHLLYAKGNALLAVPFDLADRKITGPAVTVASGIIEAPSLGVGTVNIGDRQRGRVMADSVICCGTRRTDIREALEKLRSAGFRAGLAQTRNPYGDGAAAHHIMAVLREFHIPLTPLKMFHDLPAAGSQ